jgi:Ca2+-transporting ATPase
MDWHTIKEEEVISQLKTRKEGLSPNEARKRLKKYGENQLKKTKKLNALKIFLSQFASFLIIVLIIASIISAFLNHWIDFSVILIIVFLNSFLGFFQEYKAEKAIEKLKKMLVPKVKVIRNNKIEQIDSRKIVPGDILVLNEGDKVMADARIIQCENLQINEAPLTGESNPEEKQTGVLKKETTLADRTNILYQGTEVVRGTAKAVVVATGMSTEFGKVAKMVQEVKQEKNPFKEKLDRFAKKLGVIIIGLIIIVSIIGYFLGFDKLQIFLTAVSLAVSAIPEGMPAVITITLALATKRMLKVKSLIRKLPAAETLGRTTVIASDKTGTMTEEKMQVKSIFVNGKPSNKFKKNKQIEFLFKIGILCNNARLEEKNNENGDIEEYIIGDPTEKALLMVADKYGLDKKQITEQNPRIKEFPFSSERKMMSIIRLSEKSYINYVKGAPEIILEKSGSEIINGKVKKLDEKRKKQLIREYEKMASQGLRVLGFAYKEVISKEIKQEKVERNLVFVGFQGMIDPARPDVKKAIKDCQKAGIKVIMITGDSAITAKAIGRTIGLKGKLLTSKQLKKMSDEVLKEKIKETSVFARVSPEDKLRIVKILKQTKEIVAVTGDGVNDAPALKKADIGIAVGRGTDVAKDASDMIILDNNFASIVKAVKEGRRVYDNVQKFVKYMLSANFYEIILILFAIIIGLPLPLLPLQILWLNLITDSLPALSLSTEQPEQNIMKRKPSKKEILHGIKGFIFVAGILVFIASLLIFYLYLKDIEKARTMAATTGFLFEMILVFNCKAKGSIFKSRFNKYILYAIGASLALHLIVLYTPLNSVFSFVPLGIFDWLKILGLGILGFFIMELAKLKLR